jgi:phenylalanyl-tRNA synthetase alpha chain
MLKKTRSLTLFKNFNKKLYFSSNIKNIPKSIEDRLASTAAKLYKIQNHPLNIIKGKITNFFLDSSPDGVSKRSLIHRDSFPIHEDFHPLVSFEDNFSNLLVTRDNDTVNPKNTYYQNEETVLRTHMTAHDVQLLKKGLKSFITIGDVYRRDSIDSTHYPIFHQIDGVKLYKNTELIGNIRKYPTLPLNSPSAKLIAAEELKYLLTNLNKHLFGENVQYRWVDAYFPFTDPSFELEVFFNGDWLEVLGCGILRDGILEKAGLNPIEETSLAFGIGLERLAMRLFNIKDIRLFWSEDKRFLNQFKDGKIKEFKPYSKYPPCYKDISFYHSNLFNENDLFEIIREVAGNLVEEVKLFDTFEDKKTGKSSKCYRILYRHMDKSLTNDDVNKYQIRVRELVQDKLNLELR